MKIGIFLPTFRNGWIISKSAPQFTPSWSSVVDAAKRAEEYGFEFVMSGVKMRGFDGETRHWNDALDSMAVAAGLALATERVKIYGSVGTLAMPPALTARQAATIGDMSDGRFAVNIVSGWEKPEYTQQGLWPGDQHFKTRYDHASEYCAIMRELWEKGRCTFDGEYFQMDDCMLGPLPEKPIDIVCAGSSDRGLRFCAEYGDLSFTIGKLDADSLRAERARLDEATDAAGREVLLLPLYRIVVRDSEQEALEQIEDWRANQDLDAVAELAGAAKQNVTSTDKEGEAGSSRKAMMESNAFLFGIPTIAGDPETIAAKLTELSAVDGIGGMMFHFGDFGSDVDRFGEEVMPLLAES